MAANTRTITVNAGAMLEFQAPNTFGVPNATAVPTLVVNSGTVTNADPATTHAVNNALNNVTLINGTLTSTAGASGVLDRGYETYGAWNLNGTVTSSGTSVITTTAASNGQVLLNSSSTNTTFNVTDGTLAVSAVLIDGERGTVPEGYATNLTKTGTGMLILSAADTYTGTTIINAGTLALNGSLSTVTTPTAGNQVTVTAGATLTGNGDANNRGLMADGAVAPGNGIGHQPAVVGVAVAR